MPRASRGAAWSSSVGAGPVSRADAIRSFWFGRIDDQGRADPACAARWFAPDEAFDDSIRNRFESDLRVAAGSRLRAWESDPGTALALVLLLDQFPRNIYRGTPRAFAFDGHAERVADRLVEQGDDAGLWPIERAFVYMPFEHAESPASQDRAVALFEQLRATAPADQRATFDEFLRHAEQHREVIARFGRFPHRNAILGREDTPEEREWLAGSPGGWGQSG